jgi:hypothetical protein
MCGAPHSTRSFTQPLIPAPNTLWGTSAIVASFLRSTSCSTFNPRPSVLQTGLPMTLLPATTAALARANLVAPADDSTAAAAADDASGPYIRINRQPSSSAVLMGKDPTIQRLLKPLGMLRAAKVCLRSGAHSQCQLAVGQAGQQLLSGTPWMHVAQAQARPHAQAYAHAHAHALCWWLSWIAAVLPAAGALCRSC